MKETLLLFLILFALNAVPAWLKKRRMKSEGTKETQEPESRKPAETSGAPPSLQDLIRKFNERQKEFRTDGDESETGANSKDKEPGENGDPESKKADENPDDDNSREIDTARRIPNEYKRAETTAAKRTSPVEVKRDVHETHNADALNEEPSLIEAHRKAELMRKEAELEAAAKAAETEKVAAAEIGAKTPAHSQNGTPAAPNAAIRNFKFDVHEARRGFLWAKVIDDPRFRRRNPFQRMR